MIKKDDLENDLKDALRAKDSVRKNTIRMVLTSVKLGEVENKGPLDEKAMLGILQKQAKMRRESIAEATAAERMDLIPALEEELSILETYLPEQMSEEEIETLAMEAIRETGAEGPQEMGKVMKLVMPRIEGRADGKVVSSIVRTLLTKV
jgi:uncharacterized protein YqeY